MITAHPGLKIEDLKFGMRVIKRCKTALERQVGEAVHIEIAQRKGYNLLNSKSEFSRCSLPRLMMGNHKDIREELENEKLEEKNINEKIRNLKKRPKEKRNDALEEICNEILEENRQKWKKRKILRGEEKRLQDEKDEKDWDKFHRLEKAKIKKKELMERIRKVDVRIGGKNLNWIRNKQRLWREFREKEGIDKEMEKDLMKCLIEKVPIRENREGLVDADPIEVINLERGDTEKGKIDIREGNKVHLRESKISVKRESEKERGTVKRGDQYIDPKLEKREGGTITPSTLERKGEYVGGGWLERSDIKENKGVSMRLMDESTCSIQKVNKTRIETSKNSDLSMRGDMHIQGGSLGWRGENVMGVGLVESESHKASSAQFEPQEPTLINQILKPTTPMTTSSPRALIHFSDQNNHSEPKLQTELNENASELISDVESKSEGEIIAKVDAVNNETGNLSKLVKSEKSVPSQQRHLLKDKVNACQTDQSGSSIMPAKVSDINLTYELSLKNRSPEIAKFSQNQTKIDLENVQSEIATLSPSQTAIRIQINPNLAKYDTELNRQGSVELKPFVSQCDPTKEGNKGFKGSKCLNSNYCQTQPQRTVRNIVKNTVENVNSKVYTQVQKCEPTKEGKTSELLNSPKNAPKLASDIFKVQSGKKLGARPKKSKACLKSPLRSQNEDNSELKALFLKMRLKKEAKSEEKSPVKKVKNSPKNTRTPAKCTSPSKLLKKFNKSPKEIMRDLKHKIEGNRVLNLVRTIESRQQPNSPKSAKARSFGSVKKFEKKTPRSKRKLSILENQAKIDSFFRKESKEN